MDGNYLQKRVEMKFLVFFLLIALSSCSVLDNEQDIEGSQVIAVANDPIFSVLNKSNSDIFFIVIETQTSHLVDIAITCDNPELALKTNQRTELSYSDILGWDENAESVWFYWTNCEEAQGSKTIKL